MVSIYACPSREWLYLIATGAQQRSSQREHAKLSVLLSVLKY